MAVDRSIHLDVSVPDFGSQQLDSGKQEGHRGKLGEQPDKAAIERFEAAFDSGSDESTRMAERDRAVELNRPAGAFGLFGGMAASVRSQSYTDAAPREQSLMRQMGDYFDRLMVGDGTGGSKQVRLQIKDEVLPGVTVAIQECEGRLQVDFICSIEASRLRLNDEAPGHANALAERLQREILLRVQTDDEQEPCLTETLARP